MDTEHTPLPWTQIEGDIYDAAGDMVAVTVNHGGSEYNAALIVHSVNLLPELVEALREAERYMVYFSGEDLTFVGPGMPADCLGVIRAAIAKATS